MGRAIPDRADFASEANYAVAWFGAALITKHTPANVTGVELDLSLPVNRFAIREALAFIVRDRHLAGCEQGERARRLLSWGEDHVAQPVETAAVCSALAIHFVDQIAKLHKRWPRDGPLRQAIEDLRKHCFPGAAQMLGTELPPEVAQTWPHFACFFRESRSSGLWPPDV